MITLDEQIEWVETLRRPNGYMNLAAMVDATLATLRSVKQAEPVAWVRFCSDGGIQGPILDCRMEEVRKKSGVWTPLYAAPAAPQSGWVSKAVDALKKRMDKNDSFNENTGLEAAVQELETLDKAAPGREG